MTDANKRKIYDQYGEEGLEGNVPPGAGGFGFEDLLRNARRDQGPRKAKSVLHLLEVPLSDIYAGAKKKMKVTRDRVCQECKGKGGKEDSITECATCGGAGRVAKVVRMGFMVTQTITHCEDCRGKGRVIKDKCKKCNGKCVIEEVKIIDVEVDKGTPEGHRFVFAGEADEYPGVEAGDVIIEVHIRKDKIFHRKGADLYIDKEITLFEALAGTRFEFTHLDGRKVLISTPPGKIIGNGETMCVEELGMPFFKRSYKYGNLFVVFTVTFPATLTKAQRKAIQDCLHLKETETTRCDPRVKDEFKLKAYNGTEKELLERLRRRSMEEDEEDEDEEMGSGERPHAQRVECASQ